MANVIGEAEIVITANPGNFQKDLDKKTQPVGKRIGAGMAKFAGRALRTGLTAGAVAVGAAAGAAVIGGFKAAVSRQNSQKVLSGLYGSAKKATKMMGDLRAISKNSPLEYTAYQKAAQSLAYAGVEGKAATGTLKNVGKAIVAAGGDSSKLDQAMGGVMKAVNNGGIAMMDSLEMISDSGVPILSGLAEKFGVPIDQVKKMASEGKVSIDDVLSVMQNGTGKTFKQMVKAGDSASKSFGNQWKIMKDNVANAVGDVMLPAIEKITPALEPIGNAIVSGIGKLPAIMSQVGSVMSTIAPYVAAVAAGFVAWNTGLLIHKGIAVATMIIDSQWLTLTGLRIASMYAMAAAQRVLNSAMTANPIGLIITALVALVAGLVLAYNKVGWFRDAVNAAWAGIKTAVSAVSGWFMNTLWPGMKAVWDGIAAGALWLYNSAIKPAWDGIMAAVQIVISWFQTYVQPVIKAVFDAVGAVMTWLYENIVKPVFKGIQLYIKAWWTVVSAIFNALVKFFNAVLKPAFEIFGEVVRVVFQLATGVIKIAWAAIKIVFTAMVSFLKTTLGKAFKWFRDSIIRPVWDGIKRVINSVWSFIKTYVFKPIVSFINSQLAPRFRFFQAVISAVWGAVKAKIRDTWNKYIKPVLKAIVSFVRDQVQARFNKLKSTVTKVWNGIKSKITAVWKGIKKFAFDPLANAIKKTLPKAFTTGKNAIGKAWDKVQDVAKKPVKFVVKTVINDGIIGGFNKIAGKFGVKKIGKFKLPKGFDSGGWTGPGRKLQPAGVVHADEYVIRKAAQRKITRRHGRGALNYINQTGNLPGHSAGGMVGAGLPGFAGGGSVGGTLSDAARWLQKHNVRITEFKKWGQRVGTHSRNSQHYTGNAFDANAGPGGENATEKGIFDRLAPKVRDKFPNLKVLWRVPGHHNHMHVGTGPGGKIGSGGPGDSGFDIGKFLNPFKGLFDKIKGGVAGAGGFGSMVGAGAKKMVQAPIDWIKEKASSLTDFVSEGAESIGKGVAWGKGQTWAATHGVHGRNRKAMNYIVSKESGWDPRAQNPRSTASGLPQMINSTAREFIGGSPAKKFGVFKQLNGMKKYVNSRYGGWTNAESYWKRKHYYDKGGIVKQMPAMKPLLRDKGGILPPGLNLVNNATKRNEYVLPPSVTDALMNGNVGGGGDTYINVELNVADLEGLQSALQFVDMLKRDAKTDRVRTRMTAKSGEVNA